MNIPSHQISTLLLRVVCVQLHHFWTALQCSMLRTKMCTAWQAECPQTPPVSAIVCSDGGGGLTSACVSLPLAGRMIVCLQDFMLQIVVLFEHDKHNWTLFYYCSCLCLFCPDSVGYLFSRWTLHLRGEKLFQTEDYLKPLHMHAYEKLRNLWRHLETC